MNIQLRKGNFKSYRSHGYVHSVQRAEDWLKDKGEVMEKQFLNSTRSVMLALPNS
jgi:hypothetical protein